MAASVAQTNADAVAVSDEVRQAVVDGSPVVALESTIFTHGLPRPRNLEVAREAERVLRAGGVVPATIGVVSGVPTVGLTEMQTDRLCANDEVAKASVRDLPVVAAATQDAGTTVAATAWLAHRGGVRVFATGGLGGVHHGAHTSFDESADLVALSRIPVIVVSAGAKSVLDIPATLERMETLSIPVVGYRTKRYPGFYVSDSGHAIDRAVQSPREISAIADARDALGTQAALLVANPVPADQQLDPAEHDRVLAEAWHAAENQGVTGQETTPFLLDYIQRATGGRSLEVNIAAYRNNIALAAETAAAGCASTGNR